MTHILNYVRYALYALLVVVVLLLYQNWESEHPVQKVSVPTQPISNSYIPAINTIKTAEKTQPVANVTTASQSQMIDISTDVLKVHIDTLGGNITEVQLLKYPETLNSKIPYLLLNNSPETRYLAQSGLLSTIGPDTSQSQAQFTSEKTNYVLSPDQKELHVKLYWKNDQGIQITKIFTFKQNSYEIGVTYQISNQSKVSWNGNLYLQLLRKDNPPPDGQGLSNLTTYFGAAISSPDKPYEKIAFKEMTKRNLDKNITNGWAAMVQHYFVSAWIPPKDKIFQYFSRVNPDNLYTIGMLGPQVTVLPGQTIQTAAQFYSGPAIADKLEKVAPGLKLTIDYGWFWFISVILFWMMQKIYYVVGNWGWSIILVTLVIKLLFYKLSAKSYYSMNALKKLQPRIEALKEKFADDKQKFTQATLELYKKEKVNPMSGCLPILIQIPVFIALYWVLIESVYLRQAPFILWIHDLSIKDPYYVLPILMGLSMLLQQKLSPPPPDPMQAKVMMLMPVIFTVLFINFPAGLMLYWFANNTLSVLQQWYIMRSMNHMEKAKTKKAK